MAQSALSSDSFADPPRQGLREILIVASFLLAVFMVLSLAFHTSHPGLVGAAGRWLGAGLTFAFGAVAAYMAPLLFALCGAEIIRSLRHADVHPFRRVATRGVEALLFTASLCGVISLAARGADPLKTTALGDVERSFRASGAVGEFLIAPDGLGLPYLIGSAGAWLLCLCVLVVTGALLTDFLYAGRAITLCRGWLERRRERARRKRARLERFKPHDSDRVFGPPRDIDSSPSLLSADIMTAGDDDAPSHALAMDPLDDAGAGPSASLNEATDLFQASIVEPASAKPARRARNRSAAKAKEEAKASSQQELNLFADYQTPPITLLAPTPPPVKQLSKDDLYAQAGLLERKLADFDIKASVTQIVQGPVITRFELKPAPGIKINRIVTLENDIAMAMSALSVRILAPIPGKDAVGIEIPNAEASDVFLREIMESRAFRDSLGPLSFCLGKTIDGVPTVCDLATMPHLLVAGATGSGKSVCLNAIICSLLMRHPPDTVKFIMVDPKRVELNVYQDIPHLLAPVVNDPRKAAGALNWMVEQMEGRYKLLSELHLRNIDGYHALLNSKEPTEKMMGRELEPMPHVVLVIDELADLMLIARNEVEETIIRLAQLARAVGIHLILATQRPSVNVITGIIKANFPARIAFQVSSKVDSRTIIDMNGAEALLGRGDMLYLPSNSPKPERLQGCYVSDQEVETLVDFIRQQEAACYVKEDFKASVSKKEARLTSSTAGRDGNDWEVMGQLRDESGDPLDTEAIWSEHLADDLFRAAVKLVLQNRKASVSLIQRRLKIGFARSGRLVDMMQESGIVGPFQGSKPREILVDPVEYLNLIAEFERTEEED